MTTLNLHHAYTYLQGLGLGFSLHLTYTMPTLNIHHAYTYLQGLGFSLHLTYTMHTHTYRARLRGLFLH